MLRACKGAFAGMQGTIPGHCGQAQVNQTSRCKNRQRVAPSPSSVVRTLEAEDDTSAKRQRLMAGMPILHDTDVDVNMDAHKLFVSVAMPDDQGQWTQRVIDWDKKYYGAKWKPA